MARIIAIEDSPVLQRLIEITMRGTGVDVESYLGGSVGLEAVLASPPDLIVLDLGLPDLSGWEVLDRLRADPATSEIPVVVTTGQALGAVADRAGAYDAVTLEKPYTGAVLRATILVLIGIGTIAKSPA